MAYTHQEVNPTLIENTVMQLKVDENNNAVAYRITPIEGYVLHDKARDWYEIDPITGMESEEPTLGYTTGTATCFANYDFTTNPREFYAVLRNTVPENQIFGGVGDNNHEIM